MIIKFLILNLSWVITSQAMACSCGMVPIEDIAAEKINFAKITILEQSIFNKINQSIRGSFEKGYLKPYEVRVVKNYSGNFNKNIIYATPSKSPGDCGIAFKLRGNIYIYGWKDGEKIIATVCNIQNEELDVGIEAKIDKYKRSLHGADGKLAP